jgi:hypothetical protein
MQIPFFRGALAEFGKNFIQPNNEPDRFINDVYF